MFPIRACRDRCPHRPALPVYTAPLVGADGSVRPICAPILFFLFRRKKRTAAASEEASSIPFPPGRRKLHIRSLLLPFRKPTASLGRLSVDIGKERELSKPGALPAYPLSCRGRRLCRPVGQYDLAEGLRISDVQRAGRTGASAPYKPYPHAILMMVGRQHFTDTQQKMLPTCFGGKDPPALICVSAPELLFHPYTAANTSGS